MPKLDQTYVYYDNRRMKTQFAQTSFTELECAYTKLTSGSSMRLYLYLLHKISGRTPYDRNNKPRLGYYLGIEQIENAIGISRASIYRGFGDLVKHGLIEKHTFLENKDTKNIICTLSIPLNTETKTDKNETEDTPPRSQNCDREISPIESLKGNSSNIPDLNIEPIRTITPKTIINPLIPEGIKLKNEKAFKSEQRKKEVMRIVHALGSHGYDFIDEVSEFSNIYTWIRGNTNLTRRKRDIYQAIEIHNERIQARTNMGLTSDTGASANGEISGRATPENIAKDEENLLHLLDGDYNSILHDNLLLQDSFFWRLPKELQDKYLSIITKKIVDGKALKQKQYEEQKKKQEEWDKLNPTTQKEIPKIDISSKKYKTFQWDLINKFNMNKGKK